MEDKEFKKPELIIVQFVNEDIITTSDPDSSYDEFGPGGGQGNL